MENDATQEFIAAYNGSFAGILRWPQLDPLWNVLRNDAGGAWYVYAVGETPPVVAATADQVERFIAEIDRLLRKDYQEDHCGLVYVDDTEHPRFVKIYDPHNLGVVCGFSANPVPPGWIMSKIAPVDVMKHGPHSAQRKRWWARIFGAD